MQCRFLIFHFSTNLCSNPIRKPRNKNLASSEKIVYDIPRCVCSSVDRAVASGAACGGSIPLRRIFYFSKRRDNILQTFIPSLSIRKSSQKYSPLFYLQIPPASITISLPFLFTQPKRNCDCHHSYRKSIYLFNMSWRYV